MRLDPDQRIPPEVAYECHPEARMMAAALPEMKKRNGE
jgi:hypothetical protein